MAEIMNLSPKNVEDALLLLEKGFVPVSGGTDLMVRRHAIFNQSSSFPSKNNIQDFSEIFYTGRIKDFDVIEKDCSLFYAGASVVLSDLIEHSDTPPPLVEALKHIASPGIRNTATLAGNICNASPAADSLPVLYILDTEIECISLVNTKNSEAGTAIRKIAIDDFITGPGSTDLKAGELLRGISMTYDSELQTRFIKIGTRAANALSKLNIAAAWKLVEGSLEDIRIAVGACGPQIIRSEEAEDLLIGINPAEDHKKIDSAVEIYSSLLKPINDQRSTARYRFNTALRLIKEIIISTGDKNADTEKS